MSHIIALTGGICSGKSTVADHFSKFSKVSIIDSDLIARKITQSDSSVILSITKYFGAKILYPNGSINRKKLKKHIFSNTKHKKWLEELLHPLIHKKTTKQIQTKLYQSSYVIWVVPLLIEKKLQNLADRILVVDVYPNIQLNRIINRDKINELYAKNILSSQSSRKHRLSYANDIINNNNKIQDIQSQVLTLHQLYLNIK